MRPTNSSLGPKSRPDNSAKAGMGGFVVLENENLNRISDKKIKRAYPHELFATLKRSKTKIAASIEPDGVAGARRGKAVKRKTIE